MGRCEGAAAEKAVPFPSDTLDPDFACPCRKLTCPPLVSTFAALVFVTVCAKGNKGNPSDQLTTQKAAIASARQNNRYRGRYQLRLDEARKIIQ
jgi:hypothetical protein